MREMLHPREAISSQSMPVFLAPHTHPERLPDGASLLTPVNYKPPHDGPTAAIRRQRIGQCRALYVTNVLLSLDYLNLMAGRKVE